MVPSAPTTVHLPGLDRDVPALGLGTWAWGDESTWGMGGYDASLTEDTIREAWSATLDAGIALVDTAEVYGAGRSEALIGRLLAEDPRRRDDVVVATKFMPLPWRQPLRRALRNALLASIDRLGVDAVDLYQVHGPTSLRSHAAMADALAAVHAEGLVRSVGVSNYSTTETGAIHAELAARGIPLATNQVEVSLLRRRPETSGLLGACGALGVVPLAYSPIGQGRLTGKYSAASPPPGRREFSAHPMERVDRVVAVLRRVAEAHGATPSQAALAWLIAKGCVPIPGAKNEAQARQNAGALAVALTPADVAELDAVALDGTRTLRQRVWQHG